MAQPKKRQKLHGQDCNPKWHWDADCAAERIVGNPEVTRQKLAQRLNVWPGILFESNNLKSPRLPTSIVKIR
jgi:hypothetical protein